MIVKPFKKSYHCGRFQFSYGRLKWSSLKESNSYTFAKLSRNASIREWADTCWWSYTWPNDFTTKRIKQSAAKSCQLDPIPRHLLKENLKAVAPIICDIISLALSLKNGIFPTELKKASVCPLIKKSTLDKNLLKKHLFQISHLFQKLQKKLWHHVSKNID